MRTTSSIIAIGALVAAVVSSPTQDWGDEDFGPLADSPLGNNSGNNSNTTNTTSTSSTTTRTTTTITTTTTLPKYDFINVAFFKVGDATAPKNTNAQAFAGDNVTTTTTTTTVTSPKIQDRSCSINAPGQKAYFAKLPRTGCNCTAMPEPPRGWESWAGICWNGFTPHYQLTMATPTAEGNRVASFHAFCQPGCLKCNIKRTSDGTKTWEETCASQEPLEAEELDYNTCDQAGEHVGESFFIRQPADADHMGEEFCVLQEQAASVDGAITIVEYPQNTACDANGTDPLMRQHAMISQTYPAVPEVTGVCTEAYDGSYYDLSSSFDSTTNETVYDGSINCYDVENKKITEDCPRANCDFIGRVPADKCETIDNKAGVRSSYSLKIIGSGDVSQCFIPAPVTPAPGPITPKPSGAKGNKGVVIGAAIAGVAVVAVVFIFIMRKRRASRAQAYSVLQGSAYTEN